MCPEWQDTGCSIILMLIRGLVVSNGKAEDKCPAKSDNFDDSFKDLKTLNIFMTKSEQRTINFISCQKIEHVPERTKEVRRFQMF